MDMMKTMSVKSRRKAIASQVGCPYGGSAKDLKASKLGRGRTHDNIRGSRFTDLGLKIKQRQDY